jgi:hypothetical protein
MLFSIYYRRGGGRKKRGKKKKKGNNMYDKDVVNRAPTPLSHKAQPYFSGGNAHNVLDT